MFGLLQSVLLVFIEIMCCKIFYGTFGKIRYKGWINIMQFVLLFSSMCLIAFGISNHFTIRQIAIVLMFSVFMLWHVKISLKKSFVLAILFDALLLAMDYLISRWFFWGNELLGWQYQVRQILESLLAKIVLFLLILIIRKWFGKKINRNVVGHRVVKVSVLSFIYHSSHFYDVVCFWICANSRTGEFIVCYCIWNDWNEYRCVLSN